MSEKISLDSSEQEDENKNSSISDDVHCGNGFWCVR